VKVGSLNSGRAHHDLPGNEVPSGAVGNTTAGSGLRGLAHWEGYRQITTS
jgi:hypothetical protein